jgi:hypothetical protein
MSHDGFAQGGTSGQGCSSPELSLLNELDEGDVDSLMGWGMNVCSPPERRLVPTEQELEDDEEGKAAYRAKLWGAIECVARTHSSPPDHSSRPDAS